MYPWFDPAREAEEAQSIDPHWGFFGKPQACLCEEDRKESESIRAWILREPSRAIRRQAFDESMYLER